MPAWRCPLCTEHRKSNLSAKNRDSSGVSVDEPGRKLSGATGTLFCLAALLIVLTKGSASPPRAMEQCPTGCYSGQIPGQLEAGQQDKCQETVVNSCQQDTVLTSLVLVRTSSWVGFLRLTGFRRKTSTNACSPLSSCSEGCEEAGR